MDESRRRCALCHVGMLEEHRDDEERPQKGLERKRRSGRDRPVHRLPVDGNGRNRTRVVLVYSVGELHRPQARAVRALEPGEAAPRTAVRTPSRNHGHRLPEPPVDDAGARQQVADIWGLQPRGPVRAAPPDRGVRPLHHHASAP